MSPMRAFQYSSALDTHSYPAAPALETELDVLNKQIRQKDNEIKNLKKHLDYFQAPTQLKDVGKNISFNYPSNSYGAIANKNFYDSPVIQTANKRNYDSPVIQSANHNFYDSPVVQKATIKLPNPRFKDFDPITGMKRSYSPFQSIGKRCVDSYSFSRPFFN